MFKQNVSNPVSGTEVATSRVVATFTIVCEGSWKTSELVKQGGYDLVKNSNDFITDKLFPIENHDPLDRTIELFKFDHDPSDKEVQEELLRRGLEPPTYEDALYFGIKHPEEQREHLVVFRHTPVLDCFTFEYILVLGEDASGRYLEATWPEQWKGHPCVFAGIRKLVA